MNTATRDQMLDRLAVAIGHEVFNRLLASKDSTREKGRLRFWQEELFRQAGVVVSTVEEFLGLFEGVEPRFTPPPPPLTKADFLEHPNTIWYSNRRDEVSLEWFAEAWRQVPAFRENLSYELKRYASKIGQLNAPDLLPVLSAVLNRDEVICLYNYIRNHAGRESEWRQEFMEAFPAHADAFPQPQPEPEPHGESLDWFQKGSR